MDDNTRTVLVETIKVAPQTLAAFTAAYLAWRSAQSAKAASEQSLRNAHTLEQVRSSSSLTTDRLGQVVLGLKK